MWLQIAQTPLSVKSLPYGTRARRMFEAITLKTFERGFWNSELGNLQKTDGEII
jgi:hypothetical protein